MSPPRLFVPVDLQAGDSITLERQQAHYLKDVMRVRVGQPVLLFNGRDGEWQSDLVSDRREVVLAVGQQSRSQMPEPGPALLFAPIKRPRLEWLIEKAVELGANRLIPVLTERTVVRPETSDRLRARVIEAAEQCGRLTLPVLDEPVRLLTAIDARDDDELVAFADESGGGRAIGELLRNEPVSGLLVGPEGGFAPGERQSLLARQQVRSVSLGPRILRAETAAVFALSCWSALRA
jgi:16S rRNA (uracil1498-N3)-methyltransferase